MQAATHSSAPVVVLTTDSDLLNHILAGAAVARLEPELVPDADALRAIWPYASMVLVGVDEALAVSRQALPRRTEVYLVGDEARHAEARRWSVQLGAAGIVLPGDAALLESAMVDGAGHRGGRLLAVVGGAGGAGASTVAAGLCFAAALSGRRALLLDCDPIGGGIDLLVGAERIDGSALAPIRSGQRPFGRPPRAAARRRRCRYLGDGSQVLARRRLPIEPGRRADEGGPRLGRTQPRSGRCRPSPELGEGPLAVLRRADLALVVVPADLRGVAASREISAELVTACTSLGVLVRQSRVGRISVDAVADGLGLSASGRASR